MTSIRYVLLLDPYPAECLPRPPHLLLRLLLDKIDGWLVC